MSHHLMEMKMIDLQNVEFKDTLKIEAKKMIRQSILMKIHCNNLKWY